MDVRNTTVEQRRAAIAVVGGTREAFAVIAGLSHPPVGHWAQGRNVTRESEEKIAAAIEGYGWEFAQGGIVKSQAGVP